MSLIGKLFNRRPEPPRREAAAPESGPPPQPAPAPQPRPAPAIPVPPQRPAIAYRKFPSLPDSDPPALARIGDDVRARLDAAEAAVRLPAQNMDMYLVRDFMSEAECAEMIALVDADARPSTRLTSRKDPEFRTSHTCRLAATLPLVTVVEARIAGLLGLPLSHSETIQGQRYTAGQQFKLHNDYFAGGEHFSQTVADEGGQRTWTAMIFLNRPEAGGRTNFPRASVRVTPGVGTLLTWFNLDRQGLANPYTHHEGMKVEAGCKYVLTKWFREREWHSSAASDALRE